LQAIEGVKLSLLELKALNIMLERLLEEIASVVTVKVVPRKFYIRGQFLDTILVDVGLPKADRINTTVQNVSYGNYVEIIIQ